MGEPVGYTPDELAIKLPPPPELEILRSLLRPEDLYILPAATELWHIYKHGGTYPTRWNDFRHYGPHEGRFDHHLPPSRVQERDILYLARQIATCVAEVFQQTCHVDVARGEPWLAAHVTTREIALLDLSGTWPTRAGASIAINTGPRAITRQWSMSIYAAYSRIDGLWYCSSMYGNAPCVALYERGRDSLPTHPSFNRALADPTLFDTLAAAADAVNYTMARR